MVDNSTDINKASNHLSPKLTEHTKQETTTYGVENQGPGLKQP
jgi:hypothetical protein